MTTAAEEGRLPYLGRSAEQECERLYARHAEDVRRYVLMVLRNRSDADDVVQQTFLKALRALQAGVRPERPRQWLIAISHNECRMHFRRASRRPVEVDIEHAADAVAHEEGSSSVEAVREALDHLAPNQRAALVLRELEGRSYEEIAVALDVSVSAVETLLFRARRALREQLETTESCDDAQALLAAGELDELARRRLRAHTRTCRACSTLERRRRGKLAAAGRRLAGLLPFPSWLPSLFEGGAAGGAKVVAAVAAAAVATTGAVASSAPARHRVAEHPAPVRAAATVQIAAAPIRVRQQPVGVTAHVVARPVVAAHPRRAAARPTTRPAEAAKPALTTPAPAAPRPETPTVDATPATDGGRGPGVVVTPAPEAAPTATTPATEQRPHRRHRQPPSRSRPSSAADQPRTQPTATVTVPSVDPSTVVPPSVPVDPPATPTVTVTVPAVTLPSLPPPPPVQTPSLPGLTKP